MLWSIERKIVNTPVNIYPGYNVYRYSFHIRGLWHIFGKQNLHYTPSDFPSFHHHALPIIIGKEPGIKIYISAGDGPGYSDTGLQWSDLYVKRTLFAEEMPQAYSHKIIPMGPHFGIRLWDPVRTLFHAAGTYFACRRCIESPKQHLLNYFKQHFERHSESVFVPGESRNDYVFYSSTLYPTHPNYNRYRATFIEACRAEPALEFEGGLVRKDDFRVPEYARITIGAYYRPAEWLAKVKASALGFWAPGDQGAMTLKLGEFLACGKAIIAVPIRQEQLPSPLVHGEHVHFVDGSLDEMKAAVQLLTHDHAYRHKLERNARRYYEEYVTPEKAIRRFIREASQRTGISVSL